jgi:hypothetical protein
MAEDNLRRVIQDQHNHKGTPMLMPAVLGEMDWIEEFLDCGGTTEELIGLCERVQYRGNKGHRRG